jgi:hypothetical protein
MLESASSKRIKFILFKMQKVVDNIEKRRYNKRLHCKKC